MQGWYSPEYNQKVPSPVAVYSARCARSTTFVWVLTPASGKVPRVEAVLESVETGATRVIVTPTDGNSVRLFIPPSGGLPRLD